MSNLQKTIRLLTFFFLISIGFTLLNCSNNDAIPYDHEQSLITTDKDIIFQHKRTILFQEDSLSFSNEFSGARMNDAYKVGENHYRVHIDPENTPINKSPWYAFQIISAYPRNITVELQYHDATHRYRPKLSTNGKDWMPLDTLLIQEYDSSSRVMLQLNINSDTTWISAGELITPNIIKQWIEDLEQKYPYIQVTTIGTSTEGRPIQQLNITQANNNQTRGIMIAIGRQHPPEITGQLALMSFINKICDNSSLSRLFRENFEVIVIPMANPDGVEHGHWRHNTKGVDINRDWNNFHQIETSVIRNSLSLLSFNPLQKVYYSLDFHSTDEYILYPSSDEVALFPPNFTNQWLAPLLAEFNDLSYKIEKGSLSHPIFRNWINKLFQADGITFEFYDEFDRERLHLFSQRSAELIMGSLLATQQQ